MELVGFPASTPQGFGFQRGKQTCIGLNLRLLNLVLRVPASIERHRILVQASKRECPNDTEKVEFLLRQVGTHAQSPTTNPVLRAFIVDL